MAKKIPLRRCIGCGQMKSKKELIRVVKSPEDVYSLDCTGKKNGRGAYLCQNKECMGLARKTHGLERSFAGAVPADVYDLLEKELASIGE